MRLLRILEYTNSLEMTETLRKIAPTWKPKLARVFLRGEKTFIHRFACCGIRMFQKYAPNAPLRYASNASSGESFKCGKVLSMPAKFREITLGRFSFTAATRVRLPYGTPLITNHDQRLSWVRQDAIVYNRRSVFPIVGVAANPLSRLDK